MMQQCKEKGNEYVGLGKKSKVKNVQYFRDAVNSYFQAFGWHDKIVPSDEPAPDGYVKDEKEARAESTNQKHKVRGFFVRSALCSFLILVPKRNAH